jgi:hypothetical protein
MWNLGILMDTILFFCFVNDCKSMYNMKKPLDGHDYDFFPQFGRLMNQLSLETRVIIIPLWHMPHCQTFVVSWKVKRLYYVECSHSCSILILSDCNYRCCLYLQQICKSSLKSPPYPFGYDARLNRKLSHPIINCYEVSCIFISTYKNWSWHLEVIRSWSGMIHFFEAIT